MTTFPVRILALSTAFLCALPLLAEAPVETKWTDLCGVANGRELVIKTDRGETVLGTCSTISVDAIDVYTKEGRLVKIARNTLSRIQMSREKGHQLKTLGKGMRTGLRFGYDRALSPEAVVGLAAIPVTLAWGAVSAPFCLLGDLRYHLAGRQEIKVK